MGFLKKIAGAIFGSSDGETRDPDGIYLYIKCARCGSPVRVRADRRHDLQRDYDTGEYVLHKEVMDGSCFTLIRTMTRFDGAYRVLEQEIEGGEFLTWEQYRTLTQPRD